MKKPPAPHNRRQFLQRAAAGAGLGMSLPAWLPRLDDIDLPRLPDDANVIVFQGDSITDAGRDKENQEANTARSLGHGYAHLAAAHLLGTYPKQNWQCYNRGISGNKVFQLAERWKEDCLDLQPDVLSILIGVNDFWHTLTHDYQGTVNVYERDLRTLLDLTRQQLPDVRLIIGEPFAVEGGRAIGPEWRPAFDAYRAAARQIAEDYGAAWIPYQSIFDEALNEAPVEYWCPDGVHPAVPGSFLMARAWLEAFAGVMK